MPWWSWLVIWAVLVLGLLGMLAYFAVTLFRRFMAVTDEFAILLDRAEQLGSVNEELNGTVARRPAIFADRAELEHEVEQLRRQRLLRRQMRRDARIRRAKILGSTPPS